MARKTFLPQCSEARERKDDERPFQVVVSRRLHTPATRTADVQRYGGAMAGNRGAGGLRVMGDGRVVLGKPALII